MPDLSGFPALDVAIGLAFLFFLLSTVCSAINEAVANVLGWRAKTLEDAIRKILADPKVDKRLTEKLGDMARGALGRHPKERPAEAQGAESELPTDLTRAVLGHWRIAALVQDPESPRRRRSRPSYLPAKAFSLAVAETLAQGAPPRNREGEKSPWQLADQEILKRAEQAVERLPSGLRPLLQKAVTDAAGSLEKFRTNVETAFDDAMERASGWYKRKVQVAVAVLAAILALGLNVDTLHIGTRLWKDDALRAAVVAKAGASEERGGSTSAAVDQDLGPTQRAVREIDQVNELDLPLGWGADNAPESFWDAVKRIPGWIITIAALTLGAPFWFDLLSRVARLRGSGVPSAPRSLSDRTGGA